MVRDKATARSTNDGAGQSGLLKSIVSRAAAPAQDDGYVPMRDRFKAWWNGDDVAIVSSGAPRRPGPAIVVDEDDEDDDSQDDIWSPARLELIQRIWGKGFIEPGGARFTKKLLGWMALNSKQSVLDLTAGLGGTARSVAQAHNLWMDALEPVTALAAEARRQSVTQGLGRQVPVSVANLEAHDLAKARYDAIYSRERLFTIRNKAGLLAGCAEALKGKGQILFTDYVRADGVGGAELAEIWGRYERQTPNAWTMQAYVECLKSNGLNIMIAQDISNDMVDNINWAWRRVPKMIADGEFSRRQVGYLMREGEIWLDRLRAIENGKLIVGRIHAQRPAGSRKS